MSDQELKELERLLNKFKNVYKNDYPLSVESADDIVMSIKDIKDEEPSY